MSEIGVGLLGLGNVGAGVVRLLDENAAAIEARLGARLSIKAIAVRDLAKERLAEVDRGLLTTDVDAVVDRPDVEVVCELIGGEDLPRKLVLRAIEANKQVVTANKALLAVHGDEVFAAATKHRADVYFEAAVCGGVPVIRALREGLASDRVLSLTGIVNGTSNFITSSMTTGDCSYERALADARDKGYAEADPTLDVNGTDAAHKLAILAMLCFGTPIALDSIYIDGIDQLEAIDYRMAREFGCVIKPLAIAADDDGQLDLRVHPTLLPAGWLLADVPANKNALYVRSYALGSSLYYGAGAGMMPTAMAVVSDLIEVARNIRAGATCVLPHGSFQEMTRRPVRSIEDLHTGYYLRFGVADRPGVLGQLTTILGEHRVSIAELFQHAPGQAEEAVNVVVKTHSAREGDVRAALKRVEALPDVVRKTRLIRFAS